MANIKSQRFGVEVEMVGLNNEKGARVMANLFGTTAEYEGGYYNKWIARDAQGRKWTCMSDGSIAVTGTEMVTPILGWDDIELLQNVIRAMREAGGKSHTSCGIHVHVDASEHTAKTLINLTNMVNAYYDLMKQSLGFGYRVRWCNKANEQYIKDINKAKPATVNELAQYYYGASMGVGGVMDYSGKVTAQQAEYDKSIHYHQARYQLLNLHSFYQGKGVEFRAFNSTMHAGEIKAYVQFCCALNAHAINLTKVSPKKRASEKSEKEQFADFLWQVGLRGKDAEFKTARLHLLKNLRAN